MNAQIPPSADLTPPGSAPLPRRARAQLIEGPLTGHLIRMAAPMTWGIFASISFQLVDLFFIAMLGTDALAAVSFTLPVSMAVFSLILGLAIGTSSVLSRRLGQTGSAHSDPLIMTRLTTHALMLGFTAGCLLAFTGLLITDPLFCMMGAAEDMMPTIRAYIHTWFAGAIFLTLPMISNAALRAHGNALYPAVVMTLAALTNAILSPIMIFGFGPIPAMNVRGAALATVIVNAGAMMAALYMLGVRMKMIRLHREDFAHMGRSWKELLMIGLPAGITNVIPPLVNGLIITLLAATGAEAVAAFGIVSRVEAFAFVVIMGLAGGMAPIIGQNWGANRFDRVRETLRKAIGFNVIWSLLVALILGFWGRPVAALFSANEDVIAIAAQFFLIVPITYAAGNLVAGWASAFNAIGAPERAALMVLIRYILVLVPAVLAGQAFGGITGIFIAIALTNLLTGLAVHFYGWRQSRKWGAV